MSVNLGRVICQTDPKAAADRDAAMAAARASGRGGAPEPAVAALPEGFVRRDPTRLGGRLGPQGAVTRDGATGLFDEVVGTGFALLCAEPPDDLLDPVHRDHLDHLGVRVVHLVPPGGPAPRTAVVDAGDVYLPFLAGAGAVAALVRPDFYLFGGATDAETTRGLIDHLVGRLDLERLATT